jgi:hypothetical protein
MTTMVAELYDALLPAGTPDEKARKAAEAMAGSEAYEQRLGRMETDIGELKRDVGELRRAVSGLDQRVSGLSGEVLLVKWMLGFVLALQVGIAIKLFLH